MIEYLMRFFQEDKNIGEIGILKELAKDIGLDEEEFEKVLLIGKYTDTQKQMLNHAYNEINISAVPTFIIGNKVITGFNSKEDFEKIINNEIESNLINELSCDLEGICK